MTYFIDTSFMLALLDGRSSDHATAVRTFGETSETADLVTTNYVTVEAMSLMQRRFGRAAVTIFLERIVPMLDVVWVDRPTHDRAAEMVRRERRRGVSIVDHVSFDVMRGRGIATAMTLDRDFTKAGFSALPG